MRVKIETQGETPEVEELELDLNLENLTMREAVRLEETIGEELWDRLMDGKLSDGELLRPKVIRGILYTKLKSLRPELEIDQFDVDLTELMEELGSPEALPKAEEPSSE